MSRNFEIWQRASEQEPVPVTLPPPPPARTPVVPSSLGQPNQLAPRQLMQAEPADFKPESSEWLRAVNVLKKHWRWSVLFAIFIAASVAVVTILMKPVYEPEARLEVDPPGSEVVTAQGHNEAGPGDYVDTQAQNLQSEGLALEVIRVLRLDQSPDFGGSDKAAGGVTPPRSSDSAVQLSLAEDEALAAFNTARKVTHDPGSRLIAVTVAAHNPVMAAQITNTLVNLFIEADFKVRNDSIAQWQRQLDNIRKRMDDSNRALASFQNTSGFSASGDHRNPFSKRVLELRRQLTQAQADRIEMQAYLDKLDSVQTTSLPQISSDPVVQQLTAKLAEAKAELAQALAVYGENHPNSKNLQNEVNELQSQLDTQIFAIFGNSKTSYTASKARDGLLQLQMNGARKQTSVMAQYNALKREADANTQLYAVLYQRIKEVAIAAETKSSSIRIVDQARVLNHPTRPRRVPYIGFGVLAGLVGGLMLAFLLESLDTRIYTPDDIRRCLGAESVSIMPVIGGGARCMLPQSDVKALPGYGPEDSGTFLLDRPNSPEAEALRGIYTAVRLSWRNNGGAARVLMIASALPGEGKTMLSVNLALALAQQGSTCIVDADLRKRGVAPLLRVSASRGLGDVLSGNMELDEAFVPYVHVPGLSVLPAGAMSGEPGVLIASSAMSELVGKLRQRFEFVVIDSPPILPVADARLLSSLVDGILMIGRSGVTTRANMKRAMEMLREVRSAPVLEFVLNAAEDPAFTNGYYQYGDGDDSAEA
jgi:capsular exopolysaccharide synthesis family protein